MDELKELAVEGVGLTRYDMQVDDEGRVRAPMRENGGWVRYIDAAAALAAKEDQRRRAGVLCRDQTMRAERAEAERDALMEALTTFLAALRVAISGSATNAQLEAMAGLLAEQLSRGLTQTQDDPPPVSDPHP